jgi:CRP/FNR family transcriptional regulator, anaerobic regulatory protein
MQIASLTLVDICVINSTKPSYDMKELLQYLNNIHPLSTELIEYLNTTLKTKSLSKKDYLFKNGQVCSNIYFIEKGLLRCFYTREDKEVCSWFMKEGDVAISVESFLKQIPSYESIQALENCVLHHISYSELQFVYKNFSEFNFVGRILTEKYYISSEQRLYSLRMQKSSEKYAYLQQYFPEFIQRIPSRYLASYLGVTEETLSRTRSKK